MVGGEGWWGGVRRGTRSELEGQGAAESMVVNGVKRVKRGNGAGCGWG